jgi:hypothetical protein
MDLQETIKRALADEFDKGVKSALEEYGGDAGVWSVVDGKLVDGRGVAVGDDLYVIAGEHNKALSAAKFQAVPELKIGAEYTFGGQDFVFVGYTGKRWWGNFRHTSGQYFVLRLCDVTPVPELKKS